MARLMRSGVWIQSPLVTRRTLSRSVRLLCWSAYIRSTHQPSHLQSSLSLCVCISLFCCLYCWRRCRRRPMYWRKKNKEGDVGDEKDNKHQWEISSYFETERSQRDQRVQAANRRSIHQSSSDWISMSLLQSAAMVATVASGSGASALILLRLVHILCGIANKMRPRDDGDDVDGDERHCPHYIQEKGKRKEGEKKYSRRCQSSTRPPHHVLASHFANAALLQ